MYNGIATHDYAAAVTIATFSAPAGTGSQGASAVDQQPGRVSLLLTGKEIISVKENAMPSRG